VGCVAHWYPRVCAVPDPSPRAAEEGSVLALERGRRSSPFKAGLPIIVAGIGSVAVFGPAAAVMAVWIGTVMAAWPAHGGHAGHEGEGVQTR
jgi:hypothetical protein